MKAPSILSVTLKEVLSFWSIIWIITFTFLYVLFTLFLLNYRFILTIITTSYSLSQKTSIISSLLGGLFTAFSPQDSIVLILNAALVSINMLLIAKTLYFLGHQSKVRFSVGGATIFGLISTGCSSCGFSILSILGLSTSFSFLPFHGFELHILAVAFLFFSAYYMLKKIRDSVYCKTRKN